MEIPDLVRTRLGDEEIRAGVSLGEEDAVCLTPTRVLVYRGEGLLSDESVSVLPLDVDRLEVSEGRRKTKFSLTHMEGTDSFTVPANRGEKTLELLLEGVLRVAGVIGDGESVRGVFRFSELTVIVTDGRLVKHVGAAVIDEDFEEFPFADVTGLDFEGGSVATQVVLHVDGRPQRIKAPNDDAPKLRQTLQQALFASHEVDSLEALNEAVRPADGAEDETDDGSAGPISDDMAFDEDIDPLVGGGDESTDADAGGATADSTPAESDSVTATTGGDARQRAGSGSESGGAAAVEDPAVSPADVAAMGEQLETLTSAVQRQNELLQRQQRTIEQLIEELRQGR